MGVSVAFDQDDIERPVTGSNGLAARSPKGFAFGPRVFAPFDVAVRRTFS